jgi:denticleless
MLDSPEAPRCDIFSDATNVWDASDQLPTPATSIDDGKLKRRISQSDETPTKKPRLLIAESSNEAVDVDVEMDDIVVKRRGCRRAVFRMLGLASNDYPAEPRRMLCELNSYHFAYLSE